MSALCPRYINIRRGQIICAFVGGWALCPWEILANATGFLSFMSGYTVFLGPIAGIMITDVSSLFFFLRRAWLFIFGLGVSIGSCIAEMLMFRRCIDRTGVINIQVES